MITSLCIQNFRGFSEHEVPFRQKTVMTGANNAGKSTLIEAIRLVQWVCTRAPRASYSAPPEWLQDVGDWGFEPSTNDLEIERAGVFHRYDDPPAVISASFDNGIKVILHFGPDQGVFASIYDQNDRAVASDKSLKRLKLPKIHIMPQVGPVVQREPVRSRQHVLRSRQSHLFSQHFRNQLCEFADWFPGFRERVEDKWPRLQLHNVEQLRDADGAFYRLPVHHEGFTGELFLMGHGMQIWLQMIWFLTLAPLDAIIVLDEPDVYMHADLQRRVAKVFDDEFAQIILATHSTEILAEAQRDTILMVDRHRGRSVFANDDRDIQRVLDGLGSVQNRSFAELHILKRFLVVEGEDVGLLRHFQDAIGEPDGAKIDTLPTYSMGGSGVIRHVMAWAEMFEGIGGQDILVYCILDSDCMDPETVAQLEQEAASKGLHLHIWQRKEIENYVLVPEAIIRCISQHLGEDATPPTLESVIAQMNEVADRLADETLANMLQAVPNPERKLSDKTRLLTAKPRFDEAWASFDGRMNCIPGKAMLRHLSKWAQETYGVALNSARIVDAMHPQEVAPELAQVIRAIAGGRPLAGPATQDPTATS